MIDNTKRRSFGEPPIFLNRKAELAFEIGFRLMTLSRETLVDRRKVSLEEAIELRNMLNEFIESHITN